MGLVLSESVAVQANRTCAANAQAIALEVGWEVGLVSDSLFMISPFAHVHYSTLADPGPGTLLGLTLVAAGFTAVGLYGLRRRDLVPLEY